MQTEHKLHFLEVLFGFHGKITRKEWWLANFLMWGLTLFILVFEWKLDIHPVLLGAILTIILLWMRLAVNIKRLHDSGMSRWWVLLEIAWGVGGVILFAICAIRKTRHHENTSEAS